jgi:hypothetical protein
MVFNWLNLNLALAGFSWPLYIGDQVSRIRSGSIQITMFVYDASRISTTSMLRTPHGPKGYQDNGPY